MGKYERQGAEDNRFVDYVGPVQSFVTSAGVNDSGLFEANLRDERLLYFEGAGAESTWRAQLADPKDGYPAFDYATISDLVLHIRFTARPGVDAKRVNERLKTILAPTESPQLALLFSLRHDFPAEWQAFAGSHNEPFRVQIRRDFFPYFTQSKNLQIRQLRLYGQQSSELTTPALPKGIDDDLNKEGSHQLDLTPDAVLKRLPVGASERDRRSQQVFLLIGYSLKSAP